MKLSFSDKIFLSRGLTRSGDQAWDFAVPLALLFIFPNQLRIAATYFLIIQVAQVLLFPRFSVLIDRLHRQVAMRVGILLQLLGVILGSTAIFAISQNSSLWLSIPLVLGGIFSNFGANFMDIAIANDLVPAGIESSKLAHFNARLSQIDLFTEVGAPVLAGVLMAISISSQPLFGFLLIAVWNIISFFPEYFLLNSVIKERPELKDKIINIKNFADAKISLAILKKWKSFFQEPVAPVVIAYAVLWLSVLSPHGVLLTGFLKDAWQLPEWIIGGFRGFGAIFGLMATFLFPLVLKKVGLLRASRSFLLFQAATLLLGLGLFFIQSDMAHIAFLAFILFSRIGLYGFSLGEVQIRQILIPAAKRGEINGFAKALTGTATLMLYGAGALLPSTEYFAYLVVGSTAAVSMGAILFLIWTQSEQRFSLE